MCYHRDPCRYLGSALPPEAMLMFMSHVAAEGRLGLWPKLQQKAVLMSGVCTAAGDHPEVCVWHVLTLRTSVDHAVGRNHLEVHDLCSC